MNAKSDPSEEERKGGSGHIGKVTMSMDDKENNHLCVVAYVPPTETHHNNAKDWLKYVLKMVGAGEDYPIREDSNANYAQVCIENDGDKGHFCIKMRDYSRGVLRTRRTSTPSLGKGDLQNLFVEAMLSFPADPQVDPCSSAAASSLFTCTPSPTLTLVPYRVRRGPPSLRPS